MMECRCGIGTAVPFTKMAKTRYLDHQRSAVKDVGDDKVPYSRR